MAMGRIATLCLVVLVSLTISVPVSAGTLDGLSDAIISGSTTFQGSSNPELNGYVDWAAITADDFDLDTGGQWAPLPGQVVYLYQVFSEGSDQVSKLSVPIHNPAYDIGDFVDAAGDVAPISAGFTSTDAYWNFDPKVGQGENSTILAFCSWNTPINGFTILVDGGSYAIGIPVPTPGGPLIPEPGTITLLIGLVMATMMVFGRKK